MYFTYECYFLATISVNLCNITPPRNQYTDLVSCSEFVLALYKSLSSFFFFVFFFSTSIRYIFLQTPSPDDAKRRNAVQQNPRQLSEI